MRCVQSTTNPLIFVFAATEDASIQTVEQRTMKAEEEGIYVLMKEWVDGYIMSPDVMAVTNKEAIDMY